MNNDQFLVEDYILEDSRKLCSFIKDKNCRNKAAANIYAAKIANKYFEDIKVDIDTGLHNVSKIYESYEISDVYLQGNNYIDVRLYFNDGELFVPKVHFDFNATPLAYMFIKADPDLASATVTGFVFPENIEKKDMGSGYYKVDESELVSFYEVESRLSVLDDTDLPENFEPMVFDYLDGKLAFTPELLQVFIKSGEARTFLKDSFKTQLKLGNIKFISTTKEPESTTAEIVEELFPEAAGDDLLLNDEPDELESFDAAEMADDSIMSESNGFEELEESGSIETLEQSDEVILPIDETQDFSLASEDEDDIAPIEEVQEIVLDDGNSEDLAESVENIQTEIPQQAEPEDNLSDDKTDNNATVDLSAYEIIPESKDEDVIENVTENILSDEAAAETEQPETDELGDLSQFNYSTEISPSLETIEKSSASEQTSESNNSLTEEMLDNESSSLAPQEENPANSNEQINTLFGSEDDSNINAVNMGKNKKKSPLPIILILVLLAAGGYYGYTNFLFAPPVDNTQVESQKQPEPVTANQQPVQEEAMPVETVEKQPEPQNTNEGTAVSIPAIEQNLDASILVSNLSINWEVPANYTSNSTAKRYFVKIGKIIQLNLKTELLLLSKPPITNKIALELEYNKDSHKFGIKQMTASSGEKTVDDVIKTTVQNALNMNLSMNMSVFETLQGNPVLIIKL